MLGKEGFDAISVTARDGVSAERLIDRIAAGLPETAQVRTGAEQADEAPAWRSSSTSSATSCSRSARTRRHARAGGALRR